MAGAGRGRARDFKNTFIQKGIIFGRPTPKAKTIEPLFVLKSWVEIPPRPWLRPAFERSVSRIKRIFSRRIKEAMK